MGVFRTITGAATGLVAAALAVESAPLIIGGAVAGAAINNAIGSSNDDDIAQKAKSQGYDDGYRKAKSDGNAYAHAKYREYHH